MFFNAKEYFKFYLIKYLDENYIFNYQKEFNFCRFIMYPQVIKPHCVTCTIVNKCWFKDEKDKKPDEFDYSKYPEIPLEKRGLYHPNILTYLLLFSKDFLSLEIIYH